MGIEDKLNEALARNKLDKYGVTKKSVYSVASVLACSILIIILSIFQAGFNSQFWTDISYWVNLAILIAISIFGMMTGEQIGDDTSRNNPEGRFRRSLFKYSTRFESIDKKRLFSYFEDWLELYRDRRLYKKIKTTLKDNGIHQMEVLDLDLLELNNLKKFWIKDWTGTNFYNKYYNEEKNESVTYFMSYTEEQIEIIKECKKGGIKVSKLSSTFFTDALNAYDKDMWESAAHSSQKKNSFLTVNTTYRLIGLILFSFIISGIEPAVSGNFDLGSILLNLGNRLFTLVTSIVWGSYIGMELVKIDNAYLDFKISILSLYEEEYDKGEFVPKTIEQLAKESYEKEHHITPTVKKLPLIIKEEKVEVKENE